MTVTLDRERVAAPEISTPRPSRLLLLTAILAIVVGAGSFFGGIAGAWYTYNQAAVQNIVTPDDAVLAGVPVRGPISMWAQSEIITHHQLERTGGLYYAEMDRLIPATDESGAPVFDEAGEAVMIPNAARASWLDATALTSALGLGILAYALAGMAMAVGLVTTLIGVVLLRIRVRAVLL